MTEKEIKEKMIRIKWGNPDNIPPIYANQLYVTHGGDSDFHLIFGYFTPPLTVGLEESELPEKIEINPVAKLVISPEFMGKLVDAVNENYSKYKNKKRKNDE